MGTSLTGDTAFLFTGDFRARVDTTVLLVLLGETGGTSFLLCLDFLIAGAYTGGGVVGLSGQGVDAEVDCRG